MPEAEQRVLSGDRGPFQFTTTHWSLVLAARDSQTPGASEALEQLCRTYWQPVYAFIRRTVFNPEDARDLTQGFFADLLRDRSFARANPEQGRFRSFLLGALKHFLADERDRRRAAKRGGGVATISLDAAQEETRYRLEPMDHLTPERAYEKRWALLLLDRVVEGLHEAYREAGKEALFIALKSTLTQSRSDIAYPELAKKLDLTEGALRVAVHRLRQRYRELLRREVAQTVADAAEVETELRYLFRVLSE